MCLLETSVEDRTVEEMAVSLFRFSICCFLSVLFTFNNSLASSSLKEISRDKRLTCPDGQYEHEGNICCLCPAGQRVVKHCTDTTETTCEICEKGKYNKPSSQETCQPCTSCDHPNTNLEVEEACTPGRDAKCRCKKGYYCNSETESCKLCHMCETCGSAGVEEDCTATSNTVCKEESNVGAIVGGVIGGLAAVILAVTLIWWIMKRKKKTINDQDQTNPPTSEMVPLVDLQPLVPEIVEVLGWKVMKNLATRSKIPKTVVDDCVRNHPEDGQEQTCELLEKWIEREGRDGSKKLINSLRKMNQNNAADKILAKLNSEA